MQKAADLSEFVELERDHACEAEFEVTDAEVGGLCDTFGGRTVVCDRLRDDLCEVGSS